MDGGSGGKGGMMMGRTRQLRNECSYMCVAIHHDCNTCLEISILYIYIYIYIMMNKSFRFESGASAKQKLIGPTFT